MINITVIGLGLIGGSIAKDLKSQLNVKVVGVDASQAHCTMLRSWVWYIKLAH
ncbi:MAG: hypothetical protein IPN86_04495 [Saprospiraceae bacterium]|nr:hypothetical protein [Saprospiraceae bacterium]